MTSFHSVMRLSLVLTLAVAAVVVFRGSASAASPAPMLQAPAMVEPARSILRDLFRDDGEDDFVHDDHYDWNDYRNATSRKERVRDFYEMQRQDQKSYWKQQKEAQKDMIKRQRGW
ncbi:hypothetical protein DWF00_05190 [Bosea caraganae]|uniref:DUF4148 domain-containing protein n=1 Tax=Bosea caraganae TaxID=2763117 RepID=A0A370L080_9HYPH|nr:hypothetical protein [Bosea caraganae]RDJ20670.1 hypothetical protein DWE98_23295 [Bosea caraganae]RDJ28947.1 hypothetical protein DWF00_05190 [Bosea caraganae]